MATAKRKAKRREKPDYVDELQQHELSAASGMPPLPNLSAAESSPSLATPKAQSSAGANEEIGEIEENNNFEDQKETTVEPTSTDSLPNDRHGQKDTLPVEDSRYRSKKPEYKFLATLEKDSRAAVEAFVIKVGKYRKEVGPLNDSYMVEVMKAAVKCEAAKELLDDAQADATVDDLITLLLTAYVPRLDAAEKDVLLSKETQGKGNVALYAVKFEAAYRKLARYPNDDELLCERFVQGLTLAPLRDDASFRLAQLRSEKVLTFKGLVEYATQLERHKAYAKVQRATTSNAAQHETLAADSGGDYYRGGQERNSADDRGLGSSGRDGDGYGDHRSGRGDYRGGQRGSYRGGLRGGGRGRGSRGQVRCFCCNDLGHYRDECPFKDAVNVAIATARRTATPTVAVPTPAATTRDATTATLAQPGKGQ